MQRRGNRARELGLLGAALGLALGSPAASEPEAAPSVPLEQLLKLPSSLPVEPGPGVKKRGGGTRREWQERFTTAHEEVEEARSQLDATRAKLEERAGGESAWQMSAPGLGSTSASDAPLDYQLSVELKRNREELERAERVLQELEVEANLAGVPEAWRSDPAAAESRTPETAASEAR